MHMLDIDTPSKMTPATCLDELSHDMFRDIESQHKTRSTTPQSSTERNRYQTNVARNIAFPVLLYPHFPHDESISVR
jgi:hypothetical protein